MKLNPFVLHDICWIRINRIWISVVWCERNKRMWLFSVSVNMCSWGWWIWRTRMNVLGFVFPEFCRSFPARFTCGYVLVDMYWSSEAIAWPFEWFPCVWPRTRHVWLPHAFNETQCFMLARPITKITSLRFWPIANVPHIIFFSPSIHVYASFMFF